MKRRLGVGVGVLVLALAGIAIWQCRGRAESPPIAPRRAPPPPPSTPRIGTWRDDPRTLPRASIAGTITDEANAPAAHVAICGDLASPALPEAAQRDPICTQTDERGVYMLANLVPATYTVRAGGKPFLPAAADPFTLAAAQTKTDIDLVVHHGGVAISGTVSDVSGGPVAHARVRARAIDTDTRTPPVDTDLGGNFTLWVEPAYTIVDATADGYTDGSADGFAPDGAFEVALTPAAELAGTVVDGATGQPVAGARVSLDETYPRRADVADTDGRFAIDKLAPGRWPLRATTGDRYGRSDGSVVVGLGQRVDNVVVKVWPAHRIAGQLACVGGSVALRDDERGLVADAITDPDGAVRADGVLPGTYTPRITCPHRVVRARYDAITVADADVTGLAWSVDDGGAIRGRVIRRAGTPVSGALVSAGHASTRTNAAGAYALDGVALGHVKVFVAANMHFEGHGGDELEVTAGTTVDHDIVLDDVGEIAGVVVDANGKPVAGTTVLARPDDRSLFGDLGQLPISDALGRFHMVGVHVGAYRISATREENTGVQHVTVVANATATVRLVSEPRDARITGVVLDADARPVADAYVATTLGSNTSVFDDNHTVLTAADGTFTLATLVEGTYDVRAERKGGGEVIEEHVDTGSRVRLVLPKLGAISGHVHPASAQLAIGITDDKHRVRREETFYRTEGAFTVRDLPAGHYTLVATAEAANASIDLDLAPGETKTNLDIALTSLVTLTGRVVDLLAHAPIADVAIQANLVAGGGVASGGLGRGSTPASVSDAAGRFTLPRVPIGDVWISALQGRNFNVAMEVHTVAGTGVVDIGDLGMVEPRSENPGNPGFRLAVANWSFAPTNITVVDWIDPAGAAAHLDLRAGDVVTAIDGVDITDRHWMRAEALLAAPPNTSIAVTVARGPTTVTVVLR